MPVSTPPSPMTSTEYEAIEATMCASERGRLFLAEHARRNRGADTETLLGAIRRLEQTVIADRGPERLGHLRGNLVEMAEAIGRTKAEIAAISAPDHEQTRLALASQVLDAIVRETEQATSDILGSAEAIQEAAWSLRERGLDAETCDGLDRHATAIYTACSFQDLTAQRTARIVYTLRYLEDRLSAMIDIWGKDAETIPPLRGETTVGAGARARLDDLCQGDIDRYIAMEVPAVTVAALLAPPGSLALHEDIIFVPVSGGEETDAEAEDGPEEDQPSDDRTDLVAEAPEPAAPEEPDDQAILSLAEIDALPLEERLALFA